jgi:hypothetical protein
MQECPQFKHPTPLFGRHFVERGDTSFGANEHVSWHNRIVSKERPSPLVFNNQTSFVF